MANGLFANSKTALIFAGGVLACAGLVAASMGSQYTPKGEDAYSSQRVTAGAEGEEVANGAPPNAVKQGPPEGSGSGDDVFGSYTGFASDEELIDSTRGFSSAPGQESAVITKRAAPDVNSAPVPEDRPGTDKDPSVVRLEPKRDGKIPDGALRKSPNYGKVRELRMAGPQ